jgi:hypothetical protein
MVDLAALNLEQQLDTRLVEHASFPTAAQRMNCESPRPGCPYAASG